MIGWIVLFIILVLLTIAGGMEISGRWSRHEEKEDRRILKPCPQCGKPPHWGYCCGEYFISGDDPDCPFCGTAFVEMHSSIDPEIEAWNRRVEHAKQ